MLQSVMPRKEHRGLRTAMEFLDPNRRLQQGLLENGLDLPSVIDTYFNAYNAARLREACQVLVRLLDADATVGVSLSGRSPGWPRPCAGSPDPRRVYRLHQLDRGESLPRLHFTSAFRFTAPQHRWPPEPTTWSCANADHPRLRRAL